MNRFHYMAFITRQNNTFGTFNIFKHYNNVLCLQQTKIVHLTVCKKWLEFLFFNTIHVKIDHLDSMKN